MIFYYVQHNNLSSFECLKWTTSAKAFSRISTVFSKQFILTLNLIATNPTNPKPDASLLKFLFKGIRLKNIKNQKIGNF